MNREDIIRMAREAGVQAAKLLHEFGTEGALCDSEIQDLRAAERLAEAAYAAGAAAERNKLAAWMIQFGFATGHGDTMEQLVDALGSEIVDRIEIEIDVAVAAERKTSNNAYRERNQLVALLSTLFPSGKSKTAIEGWDEAWHGCVYIDFPWGQASWHYHTDDEWMFAHLPPYTKEWDGHTTEAKYAAIAAAIRARSNT